MNLFQLSPLIIQKQLSDTKKTGQKKIENKAETNNEKNKKTWKVNLKTKNTHRCTAKCWAFPWTHTFIAFLASSGGRRSLPNGRSRRGSSWKL
jgi:hypothetical protein